jgi:hypothetical protein
MQCSAVFMHDWELLHPSLHLSQTQCLVEGQHYKALRLKEQQVEIVVEKETWS